MTRKHFTAIADAIAIEYAEPRAVGTDDQQRRADIERAAIRQIADNVASACAQFNRNFDRAKFLTRALPETVTV